MNDSVQMFNGQFPISLSWRINKNWTLVSNGTVAADRCDQMATIFFQYLAILTMKICQIAQNICQHWFTIWQNTQYPPPPELKIAKDFQNVAPNDFIRKMNKIAPLQKLPKMWVI